MSLTVEQINQTFAEKGLGIKLPLPDKWLVTSIELLDKQNYPDSVQALLSVKYVDDHDNEHFELIPCQGSTPLRKKLLTSTKIAPPLKSIFLPTRDRVDFKDEADALKYITESIIHLLEDKGYHSTETTVADLQFHKEKRFFFLNMAPRYDETASERIKQLMDLRQKYGVTHDYGLVMPAFQESLGVALRIQEHRISQNIEHLSAQRIGIYAVDNHDPNQVYAFTVYPKDKEMMRYFIHTKPRWLTVKSRYVMSRKQ